MFVLLNHFIFFKKINYNVSPFGDVIFGDSEKL